MCSMSRDPRSKECTICTARARDDVRTYGDTGTPFDLNGERLVRKSRSLAGPNLQANAPKRLNDLYREPSRVAAASLGRSVLAVPL